MIFKLLPVTFQITSTTFNRYTDGHWPLLSKGILAYYTSPRTEVTDLALKLSRLKWQLPGHICRRSDSRWPFGVEMADIWRDNLLRRSGSNKQLGAKSNRPGSVVGEAYV